MLNYCIYKILLSIVLTTLLMSTFVDTSYAYSLNLGKGHDIRIHGFLSQAYLKSDNNHFFGDSDGSGSFEYNEIGLNTSYAPTATLNLAAQLLSRRAGESDDGEIKLDFALVDYRFMNKPLYHLGTRFGRIKNPFGFYNDTRDVSFTRESIILPQSIYFERTRDLSISSNGVEVYMQRNFTLGSTILQFLAAQPRVNELNTELALFQKDYPGNLSGKASYISRIVFDLYSSSFKVAYSNVQLNMRYNPDVGNPLDFPLVDPATVNFSSNIFSLTYTYNRFTVTAEYALRDVEIPDLNTDRRGYSYYFQISHHFNHKLNIFSRYDVLFQDRNDKSGAKYASDNPDSAPAHSRFAKDLTVGAQYIYSKHWMFRIETHFIDGTAWLPIQDNPDLNDTTQKWRLFSLLLAYRF